MLKRLLFAWLGLSIGLGAIAYMVSTSANQLLKPFTAPTIQTAWNPSDKSANITLSTTNFTNDTASNSTGTAGTFIAVRSLNGANHTATDTIHKYHVEWTATAIDGSGGWIAGIVDGSATLAGFCGSDVHGVGVQTDTTSPALTTYVNGTAKAFGAAVAAGHRIELEADLAAATYWVQDVTLGLGWTHNAGGFGGSPAGGTGGTAFNAGFVTSTNVMLCWSGGRFASVTDTAVLFTKAAQFTGTVSTGFTAWDPP